MSDPTRVEWRSWEPSAFEEAAASDVPILLSLTATWCAPCHEMDARTFAEPRIAANVNDGFVPIRVDVDRHPRVRERYNMGGFPTVAFLTPSGELLTGSTYLDPDGMRQVIDAVRELWADRGNEAGRIPRALTDEPPWGELDRRIDEQLAGQLRAQFDDVHAGWGTDAKFPLPRTIEYALKRDRDLAVGTLDAIERHLMDPIDGGFFRFAERRDWSDVHYEKTAATNAAIVRAFASGYLYTGEDRYRAAAENGVEFLTDELWTGIAVGGSIGPGAGERYYEADPADRPDTHSPRRDPTIYAGENGLAATALAEYYAYTDDDRAREYAERILAAIDTELIDDGVVVRYCTDEAVGDATLLSDCARTLTAYIRARQVFGTLSIENESNDPLSIARSIADETIDRLFVDGALLDGPPTGLGLCDRPLRPIDSTAEFAHALVELSILTGNDRYASVAHEALSAFAGAADRMGVQVADYAAATARLLDGPLVIDVGAASGSDLHRAALRVADHEKVVIPESDRAPAGAAIVRGEDETPAETPEELMERVTTTN